MVLLNEATLQSGASLTTSISVMSLLWQVMENMTVGHFETAEQLAWQRAWRCTLTVPYVHKLPVQSRRSSLSLRTHSKNQAARDFGVFFMGAGRYCLQ